MSVTSEINVTEQSQTCKTAVHVIRDIFADRKLEIEKIIFFGSRVRGDYNHDSDWDFLVISRWELPIREKHRLIVYIKRQLAKLNIPNDIIIQSRHKFESQKNFPGNLSYVAKLEGVAV
jgi:predicted nucleotidyltransferase